MAKKTNKTDLEMDFDDLNLDMDMDMNGFGEADDGKNSKKPIRRLAKNFAAGAKMSFQDSNNIRNTVNSVLPKGYGTALNTGFEAADLASELYNSAANELRPAMPFIRRAVGKLSSKTQRFLPKRVKEKLEAFIAGDDYEENRKVDADNESLTAGIAEIFGMQMEEQARQRNEDYAEEEIRYKIQDKRAVQGLNISNAMLKHLERQTTFQDTIYSRALKKQLELQYRQTFYQRDILQTLIVSDRKQTELLAAIMKNTGLPEYRKKDLADAARSSIRDNIINGVQNSALNYINTFKKEFGERLKGSVVNAASGLASALSMGEEAGEMLNSGSDFGMSRSDTFANLIGMQALPILNALFGESIRKRTGANSKISRFGEMLQYYMGNLPEHANEFAGRSIDEPGLYGMVKRLIQSTLPRSGIDTKLAGSPLLEADKASPFTKQAHRSIVEIIPGFLSRIHHELKTIRTSKGLILDDNERLIYNLDRGEFTSFKQSVKDVSKRLMNPQASKQASDEIDAAVKEIVGSANISEKARKELRKQIMEDSRSAIPFNPDRYFNTDNMDARVLSYETKEELRRATEGRYYNLDGSKNWKGFNAGQAAIKRVQSVVGDPTNAARAMLQAGNREQVAALGLLERSGWDTNFNLDPWAKSILEPDTTSMDIDDATYGKEGFNNPASSQGGVSILSKKDKRHARALFRKARRGINRTFDRVSDRIEKGVQEFKDVYSKSGRKGVLDLAKLKAGEYIDETTGRTIESLKDIQGRIVNQAGEVVAEADDIISEWETADESDSAAMAELKRRVRRNRKKAAIKAQRGSRWFNQTGSRLKAGFNNLRSSVSSKYEEFAAVYTEGGAKAVFDKAKLESGEYIDEVSGKVIKSLADINGRVVTQSGELVAEADTILTDWASRDPRTEAALNTARKNIKRAKKRASQASRKYRGQAHKLYQRAKGLADQVTKDIEQIAQIRTDEGSEAALDFAKLKAGEYFDAVSREPIRRIEDIRGDIVDGYGQIVATKKSIIEKWVSNNPETAAKLNSLKSRLTKGVGNLKSSITNAISSTSTAISETIQNRSAEFEGEFESTLINQGEIKITLLSGILEAIQQGIGTGEGIVAGGQRSKWLDMRLGTLLRRGGRGLMRVGSGLKSYLKTVLSVPWKIGKSVANALGFGRDYLSDIHIANGRRVITRQKMLNGDYISAKTKKPIKSIRDIDGAVLDISSDPPQEVMSDDEYSKGLYDSKGRKLGRGILKAIGQVGGLAGHAIHAYTSLVALPFRAISAANTKLKNMFAERDIYIRRDMSRPAVSLADLRQGIVFASDRKTVIKKYRDIQGAVYKLVDGQLQEVISLEDFRAGLVDYRGKDLPKVGNRFGLLGTAAGLAGGFVKGYAKVVGSFFGMGRDILVGAARRVGNWWNPKNRTMGASDAAVIVLQQIHTLLKERIPEPEHIRAGSWQEQLRNGLWSGERKDKDPTSEKSLKNPGMFSKAKSWLGSLLGFGDDEDDDEDGSLINDAADAAILYDTVRGRRGKKSRGPRKTGGRINRMRRNRVASRLLKERAAGRAAARLGRAGRLGILSRFRPRSASIGGIVGGLAAGAALTYGGQKAAEMVGEDTVAGKAIEYGGYVGTASMVSGALGGPTITGLVAAGGGVLGAPVLIAGAAVAGAGYMAFKGYKKYKFGTYDPLRAYRLAQYGVDWNNTSEAERVVNMEQLLEEHVRQMGAGWDISNQKLTWEDLLKEVGLDDGWFSNNTEQRKSFGIWFNARFKPVYLRWVSKLRSISASMRLNDATEKLEKDQKLELMRGGHEVPVEVYGQRAHPFSDDLIEITPDQIESLYKQGLSEIDKGTDTSTLGKAKSIARAINSVTPMGMLANKVGDSVEERNRLADVNKDPERLKNLMDGTGAGAYLGARPVEANLPKEIFDSGEIDAFEAIRLRVYGLTKFLKERVILLRELERDMFENLTKMRGKEASLDKDIITIFQKWGPRFGQTSRVAGGFSHWTSWFIDRFLPAFLTLRSTLFQLDPSATLKDAVKKLTPENLKLLAQKMIGAESGGLFGFFKDSVWTRLVSPWSEDAGEKVLNADASSCDLSLRALASAKQDAEMRERGSRQTPKTPKPASNANAKLNIPKPADSNTQNFGPNPPSNITGARTRFSSRTDGVTLDSLPNVPKGARGASALRDLIFQAAHAVGVDPDVLLATASMESSLNPEAANNKTSAKGLFQFVDKTWATVTAKYGARYGITPNTSPFDPRANALMAAELMRENADALRSRLGREPTDVDLYAAHFLGAPKAGELLSANPNANAVSMFPNEAAKNQPTFYSGGTPRTVGQVLAEFDRKLSSHRVNRNAEIANDALRPKTPQYAGNGLSMLAQNAFANQMSSNASNLVLNPTAAYRSNEPLNLTGGNAAPANSGRDDSAGAMSENNLQCYTAADTARNRAGEKSSSSCAKFVSDALESARYPVERGHAFTFYGTGKMERMGFTQIPLGGPYRKGDVMVYDRTEQHPYGHIQIFDGTQWVSDFKQNTEFPWADAARVPRSLYRDQRSESSSNGRMYAAANPRSNALNALASGFSVPSNNTNYVMRDARMQDLEDQRERGAQIYEHVSRQEREQLERSGTMMESLQKEQLKSLRSIDDKMSSVVDLLGRVGKSDFPLRRGDVSEPHALASEGAAGRSTNPRQTQTDILSTTPRVPMRRNVAARA